MQLAPTTLEDRMAARVRANDFRDWRDKVIAAGGCSRPIHLTGLWKVSSKDTGVVLAERSGHILVPCGTRRASVCPPCADRYAADAFHLLRAGLAGGNKGVPESVTDKPRQFVTLTAPSFGPVHGIRHGPRGNRLPCPCGSHHHPDDLRLGTPVDPDTYDYVGAVLWQAHAGELWHRFTITLRRKLAQATGIPVSHFAEHARLSYAKVAEYQRRGLVHFHAVIRVDGPTGPTDTTPAWVTSELLEDAIRAAAGAVTVETCRPCGTVLPLTWGTQVGIRTIRPRRCRQLRGRRRPDQRSAAGRLHRQVRHQIKRRHRRPRPADPIPTRHRPPDRHQRTPPHHDPNRVGPRR
jgi:hypothetical protein